MGEPRGTLTLTRIPGSSKGLSSNRISCSCLGVHYYSKLLASCFLLPFTIGSILNLTTSRYVVTLVFTIGKKKKKNPIILLLDIYFAQIII